MDMDGLGDLAQDDIACDEALERIGGCSDRFCYVTGDRSGQVTNGGCSCVRDIEARRALMALHKLRKGLKRYLLIDHES